MSDHDVISPETDNEIRARLEAFARQVVEHADAEAALKRLPHRSRPPSMRLLAVAACLIAVIAVVAVKASDRRSIETTDQSESPTRTGDGPATLAQGLVEFVDAPEPPGIGIPPGGGLSLPAGGGLGGSTLNISVHERNGQVTGQARFEGFVDFPGNPRHTMTVQFECAGTDADDVILAGRVTSSSSGQPDVGMWIALLIREGNPDSATVWWDTEVSSCPEILESVPYPRPNDRFVDVVEGDDIETGSPPS